MAVSQGLLSKMGISAVAGWATAYSASGQWGIPYVSETLTQVASRAEVNALEGSGGRKPSLEALKTTEGTVVYELDYNNFAWLWRSITDDSSSPYNIVDDLFDYYLWLEFEKTVDRWRFGASKVKKITISGEKGGLIMAAVDFHCRDYARSGTAFGDPAYPGVDTKLQFEHMTFRVADQGDAIAAGDIVLVDSFELEYDLGFTTDQYAATGTFATAQLPIEAAPGAKRTITLKLTSPTYEDDTLVDFKDNDDLLQCDIDFTLSGESLFFEIPECRVLEGANVNVGGPEILSQDLNVQAFRSGAANPMYASGNEMRITVT